MLDGFLPYFSFFRLDPLGILPFCGSVLCALVRYVSTLAMTMVRISRCSGAKVN